MQASQSEESIMQKIKPVLITLSQQQCQFLQSFFPKFYSLHQIKKSGKKQKKEGEKKGVEKDQLSNIQSRSSRHLDTANNEGDEQMLAKRSRSKKVDGYGLEESPRRKPKGNFFKMGYGSGGLSEEELVMCNSIITQLKRNPNSKPFLSPVNPVEYKIPDYFDIITNPMDISTIESKLKQQAYSTTRQFKDDLTLIWMNSYKYNQKGSDIYFMTSEMDKLSNRLLQKLPNSSGHAYSSTMLASNSEITPKKVQNYNTYNYVHKEKKPKPAPVPREITPATARSMTIYEKRKLCEEIKNLSKQQLSGVWKIVAASNEYADLTFDVEKLPPEKLWELDAYIRKQKGLDLEVEDGEPERPKSEESSSFLLESESEK